MVSLQFAMQQEDLADGLVDLELFHQRTEADSPQRPERILLDVEKARVARKAAEDKAKEKLKQQAEELIAAKLPAHIQSATLNKPNAAFELAGISEIFTDLLHLLTQPTVSLSRIMPLINAQPMLASALIEMVNQRAFLNMLGRSGSNPIKDVQTALGYIGIDLLTIVLPVLMFKIVYKRRAANDFPLYIDKLWSHAITCALSSEYLLQQQGYKRPAHGVYAGLMLNIGHLAVYVQYERSFEHVRQELLSDLRKNNFVDLYQAMLQVERAPQALVDVITQHAVELVAQGMLLSPAWKELAPITEAIREHAEQVPAAERSEVGKALAQAEAYSMFEMLRRAKLFSKQNLVPFFAEVDLDKEALKPMLATNLRQLDISQRLRELT